MNDINIECSSGEFIGLIGPNGSGKTTLLRCINGVLKPKMGTIYVDGQNINKMKIKEIAKVCANVPTDAAEDLALTVHEFVFLGRYPYVTGMWWESKDDEADRGERAEDVQAGGAGAPQAERAELRRAVPGAIGESGRAASAGDAGG